MKRLFPTCVLLGFMIFSGVPATRAQEGDTRSFTDSAPGKHPAGRELLVMKLSKADDPEVTVELVDVELTDQDGRTLAFESDVVADKLVVIIPFYTTCPTSYPILIFTLKSVQKLLGDRLEKDVRLIALTVDPKTDTPLRLKDYAKKNQALEGWLFLTGDREDLGQVMYGAGVLLSTNVDQHNHVPLTVLGYRGGPWKKLHGFPSPQQLLQEIERLLDMKENA